MASTPWSILENARSGPTIADLYVGAKQRRLQELYQQKQMDRQDREDARMEEERAAAAEAVTLPPTSPPPSAGIEVKKAQARQFTTLAQAAGVGVQPASPVDNVAAPAQPQPGQFLTPDQARAMKANMGEGRFRNWQQKYGVPEYDPNSAARAPSPSMGAAAPRAASPALPMGGSDLEPPHTPDAGQPDNLVPAGFNERAAPQSQAGAMLTLNPAGLQRLARSNPKMAFELSKMSSDQHAAAYKAISQQVELESQIIGAVRAAPAADQARVYTDIRNYLGAKGVAGLPEQWDPTLAETHQRMGLTAMQAFQDDRAERRLDQDIADDEADNDRADRNTASVIEDRGARRGLVERGQDLSDARGRRGQDLGSADRRYAADNAGRKKGAAPGADAIPTIKSKAERDKLPKGALYRAPDGTINRKN